MNVVITGGSKGIGKGMAHEFLKRGHNVTICSRGQKDIDLTVDEFVAAAAEGQIICGTSCDVSDYQQVRNLWDFANDKMGSVDIWINNAGRDGLKMVFKNLPERDFKLTVDTNVTGMMNCCHVAMHGMEKQTAGGRIFNMEGFGSDGMTRPRLGVYGSTKYGLRYFTKTLVKECEGSSVRMCYLSPGMVVTDLLVPPPEQRDADWEKSKKVLNILADTVETVTPYLVEGVLAAEKNGDAVRWLTTGKVMKRFMFSRFTKPRDLFSHLGA
jgi:NAD(P)-dependent dehydrogenase (short-subunit alcohol dehydrogenase family)